jgi:DNA mismatch endonuclease (patch repair protein)
MSKIRSKNTQLEVRLRTELEKNGIAFEEQPKMFGKPDFFIPPNVTVFCDSSFWHGRNWVKLRKKLPEGYWQNHINRNRTRDKEVNRELQKQGYEVLRFWDTEINSKIDKCLKKILSKINDS